MSESSAPQLPPAGAGAGVPSQSLISTTLVVYALFAVAAIAGLVSAGLLSTPLLTVHASFTGHRLRVTSAV